MTLPDRVDAIVVGAGLAGLCAAIEIQRAGFHPLVLEAQDDVGGRVRTDEIDGFLLDRGFQVLLTAYPELGRYLDLADLDLRAFDPGALVWHDGRGHVVSDPFRAPASLPATALAPIGSFVDKARIALLRARLNRSDPRALLRGTDVSTIESLRTHGFSERMIERFFRPLFGGIQLDPQLATSRRMFDVIFRTLSTGSSAVPARGMGAIPRALARQLHDDSIHLNMPVRAIEGRTIITDSGERIEAGAIVVATEGPVAATLLGIAAVASRPVGCVYFAADRAPTNHKLVVLDGSGRGPVLNVAVMSNVAPSYAPVGRHLVAAALPGVVDGDLETLARTQLRSWWGADVDSWRHLHTYRIAHGGPVQRPPFAPKQAVSLGGGRFVCGDHRDTGSIQGAMFSGRRCGEAVVSSLRHG
jgi:phytoene dehydrogenase-like protein